MIAMGAIVVILKLYDQKPLPQWRFSITINSLVALFSTISKAALLIPIAEGLSQLKWLWFAERPKKLFDFEAFDKASRGSWGSLQLLGTIGVA